jgi:cytochrome P450
MMTLSLPFPSVAEKRTAATGFVAYQRYIAELIERRRAEPRDDVISDLGQMDLPVEDLVALVWSLSTGKNSLRDALGTCMLTLLSQRENWQRACVEPEAIPLMFEETLRRDAPLRGLFRETTVDVELGGVSLPKGSRLYVLYASGNRDEMRFSDPDDFIPGRDRLGAHLGFGEGSHRCLGATVARSVASIGVGALAERIPGLRLDGVAPTLLDKYFFHGLKQLQARW